MTPLLQSINMASPRVVERSGASLMVEEGGRVESSTPSKRCSTSAMDLLASLADKEEDGEADSPSAPPVHAVQKLPVHAVAHLLGFLNVVSILGVHKPLDLKGPAKLYDAPVAISKLWARAATYAHANLVAAAAVMPAPAPPPRLPPQPVFSLEASGELTRCRSMLPPGSLTSSAALGGAIPIKDWCMILAQMPWGVFLSEGAYKKVYRVVNGRVNPCAQLRLSGGGSAEPAWAQEAVSVMDVAGIVENSAGTVVEQELKVSLLVSALVRRQVCPNFVETYGVFSTSFAPPDALWGCERKKQPCGPTPLPYPAPQVRSGVLSPGSAKEHHKLAVKRLQDDVKRRAPRQPAGKGQHQYIRMELCDCGDLEEFIHAQPQEQLGDAALVPLAFQMVFALYAAQRELSMRHYDVKLLNFLLKTIPETATPGSGGGGGGDLRVCYGVAGQAFVLRLPALAGPTSHRLWVKLGDFGTADVAETTLGDPTLENTPIEQLLLGACARQRFAADTWALGLSLLHLFMGCCPYEELLGERVTCPEELCLGLEKVWAREDSEYRVVGDAAGWDEEEEGRLDRTLADTLYRYLVLFGLPHADEVSRVQAWTGNSVLFAVYGHLSP